MLNELIKIKILTFQVNNNENAVKWEHFVILHEQDKKNCSSQLRVCPKITDNHVKLLNSCLKMCVRLATQVTHLLSLIIIYLKIQHA